MKAGPGDWFALQQTILAANILKDAIRLLLDNVRAVTGAESAAARPGTAASRPPPTAASTASAATTSGGYSANSPFLLRQILVEFSADLLMIQSVLDGVIDWESSRSEGKLVVKVSGRVHMHRIGFGAMHSIKSACMHATPAAWSG